jgi:hypothetical protein
MPRRSRARPTSRAGAGRAGRRKRRPSPGAGLRAVPSLERLTLLGGLLPGRFGLHLLLPGVIGPGRSSGTSSSSGWSGLANAPLLGTNQTWLTGLPGDSTLPSPGGGGQAPVPQTPSPGQTYGPTPESGGASSIPPDLSPYMPPGNWWGPLTGP